MQASTIIDIGANRGQFVLVARHCFPQAVIYPFEPLPAPAATLHRIFAGDSLLWLYQSAIGDESSKGLIHVSAKDDSSSLFEIGLQKNRIYSGTVEVQTEQVSVVRLADAIPVSDLSGNSMLKIDVQGFELHVLKGCTELLTYFSRTYCEYSCIELCIELYKKQALVHEAIEWLPKHHFVVTGVYNASYGDGGQAVQADFLFGKSNAAAK